jgi:hypothetical protein
MVISMMTLLLKILQEVEMIQARRIGLGLIVSALALGFNSVAKAQLVPSPTGSTSNQPSSAMMMNPFYNPYMNPLLNPAAPQQKLTTSNALLYMYTANSASTPGGGAARYFNPGPVNTGGAGRYYNQRGRNFMNNGN